MSAFIAPDYVDRFRLVPAEEFSSLDDFVERLVLRQPAWLTKLSMGIGRRARRQAAIKAVRNGSSEAIGNWAIVDRDDRSVTFAEDMRIMAYRLVYELHSDGAVTASTSVEQATLRFGPTYWALATPLHRRFLPMLMRNAGGSGSTTTAEL